MAGITSELGPGTAARGLPGPAGAMLRCCGGWVVGFECLEWWEGLKFIAKAGEGTWLRQGSLEAGERR